MTNNVNIYAYLSKLFHLFSKIQYGTFAVPHSHDFASSNTPFTKTARVAIGLLCYICTPKAAIARIENKWK